MSTDSPQNGTSAVSLQPTNHKASIDTGSVVSEPSATSLTRYGPGEPPTPDRDGGSESPAPTQQVDGALGECDPFAGRCRSPHSVYAN